MVSPQPSRPTPSDEEYRASDQKRVAIIGRYSEGEFDVLSKNSTDRKTAGHDRQLQVMLIYDDFRDLIGCLSLENRYWEAKGGSPMALYTCQESYGPLCKIYLAMQVWADPSIEAELEILGKMREVICEFQRICYGGLSKQLLPGCDRSYFFVEPVPPLILDRESIRSLNSAVKACYGSIQQRRMDNGEYGILPDEKGCIRLSLLREGIDHNDHCALVAQLRAAIASVGFSVVYENRTPYSDVKAAEQAPDPQGISIVEKNDGITIQLGDFILTIEAKDDNSFSLGYGGRGGSIVGTEPATQDDLAKKITAAFETFGAPGYEQDVARIVEAAGKLIK